MNGCPERDLLERLLNDQLVDTELDGVEHHLEGCASCQRTLEELSGDASWKSELRQEVSGLLDDELPVVVADRHGITAGATAGAPESVPRTVPAVLGYEINGELGRGGMGVVYLARHVRLNRPCALKMILAGAHASPEHVARFVTEAEAIARLQHPSIVQIRHIGDVDGLPFLELEYLAGGSLDQKLDGTPWPTARAAQVAEEVGLGIAEAHRQGIVHRDLKPSNVLLTSDGTPKVGDFGLAKMLDSQGELTQSESVMGSPSYMAPEQAEGRARGAGATVDVYAVGSILYELLTGRPPFRGTTALETLEQVKTVEPVPPSRLVPGVPRDIETICLKCLQKEPGKRYESAQALGDDLRRFLEGRPILARRISVGERVVRVCRRNPVIASLVGLAAILSIVTICVTVAGLIGLAAFAAEQTRSNAALLKANSATKRALEDTQREKAKAEEALAQSEAVRTFLVDTFRSPDPDLDGKEVKVVDLLDRATQQLDQEFHGSEANRAALFDALGRTYIGLGLAQAASKLLERAGAVRAKVLGPDHPDTLKTRIVTISHYAEFGGRAVEAIKLGEETLKLCESKLGPNHLDTLECRINLGQAYAAARRIDAAIALDEETLKLCESRLGPAHAYTLASRSELAIAYRVAGRTDEAIKLHKANLKHYELKLGLDHPDTLLCRNNLAAAYRDAGRIAEAIELHEANLKRRQVKLGLDHPATLGSRNNLAQAYVAAGRTAAAIALHEGTLKLIESKLGPDHPRTHIIRTNLAAALERVDQWADAEILRRDTLARRRKAVQPDSPLLADDLDGVGRSLLHQKRWSEAEPVLRECLAIREKTGPNEWRRFTAMSLLGAALLGQRRFADAEPLIVTSYEGLKAREDRIPQLIRSGVAAAGRRIVDLYESWDKKDQAAQWRAKLAKAPTEAQHQP